LILQHHRQRKERKPCHTLKTPRATWRCPAHLPARMRAPAPPARPVFDMDGRQIHGATRCRRAARAPGICPCRSPSRWLTPAKTPMTRRFAPLGDNNQPGTIQCTRTQTSMTNCRWLSPARPDVPAYTSTRAPLPSKVASSTARSRASSSPRTHRLQQVARDSTDAFNPQVDAITRNNFAADSGTSALTTQPSRTTLVSST